jgi:two-component system chemotaxis response regulator CheB
MPQASAAAAPEMIAMAGSTGAPGVIADILAPLASPRTPPILIVQHLAQGFLDGLVHWLDGRTALSVEVARHDAMVEAGRVFVAPDDRHLGITRKGRIHLGDGPPEEGFRPSATHLFRSVAKAYGPRSVGILLSGMGRDGATGLEAICTAGGLTVAQDQATCVVFGMPGEAVRLGAARRVLPPPAIAQLIMSLTPADTEAAHVGRVRLSSA